MVSIILRKSYGGAYIAMASQHLGADFVYAWPGAEIAVMGANGAANIIFAKEIASSPNPEETRAAKIEEYKNKFSNPYIAAERGYIEDVIDPIDTRNVIVKALYLAENKTEMRPKRKHGNIPL
jgi:methylmalonyl-CoA decarboxylase subunit alpha